MEINWRKENSNIREKGAIQTVNMKYNKTDHQQTFCYNMSVFAKGKFLAMNVLKYKKYRIKNLTPWRAIVGYYIIAVIVSVLLLSLPPVYQPGVRLSFLDILFTAVSAVSVTGLTVVDVSQTFSLFGIIVLIIILQIGGIGIMSVGTFFWLVFRRKIGLKQRQLIMVDHNQLNLSGLVMLIKDIVKILLIIELLGAFILGIWYLKRFSSFDEAFLHGLFSSVSAVTNGGFTLTQNSLLSFANDYFVQAIHIILIIVGAIGFPVLIEIKKFFHSAKEGKRFRFSLFTKLTTVTFFLLLVFGTVTILLLEWGNSFAGSSPIQSFFYALFHSVSSRSGGFSTIDMNEFSRSTLIVISVLMFIGASPSSAGGGIRTTTFALNILFLYHFIRGNKAIHVFKREFHERDLFRSFAVTLTALILVFISFLILSVTEDQALMAIIFETCSAFGTTGLSMGITPELSPVGKIVIMLLMFTGRIGLLSFLFMIGGNGEQMNYHYPKEHVIVG